MLKTTRLVLGLIDSQPTFSFFSFPCEKGLKKVGGLL